MKDNYLEVIEATLRLLKSIYVSEDATIVPTEDNILTLASKGLIFAPNVKFKDQETSLIFNKYINYNGLIFTLKDNLQLDSNVSQIEGFEWPLNKALNTNRHLIEYLNNLDFSEIILKKAELYGKQNIDESTFSHKELIILNQLNFNNVKKLVK